jgi:phosphotransacetylase
VLRAAQIVIEENLARPILIGRPKSSTCARKIGNLRMARA